MVLPEFGSTVRELPGVHVIALHGELDMSSAECVDEALAGIEGSTVVVDLSRLTFMDSTGITALVGARNRIMDDGPGQLVLSRPVCAVRRFRKLPDCAVGSRNGRRTGTARPHQALRHPMQLGGRKCPRMHGPDRPDSRARQRLLSPESPSRAIASMSSGLSFRTFPTSLLTG